MVDENKQTVKFLYDSKVQTLDRVRPKSSALVTSDGIYNAIKEMTSSTVLADSGYIADCITGIEKCFHVELHEEEYTTVDNEVKKRYNLVVGSETEDSVFFIPDGFAEDGVTPYFDHVIVPKGEFITKKNHLKDTVVRTCDLAAVMDFTDEEEGPIILLNPTRTSRPTAEGEPTDRYYQYIFAREQNPNNTKYEFGPKTDINGVEDEGTIWWDLTTNQMKVLRNSHWVVVRYSIPFALISYEKEEITGFANDFTVAGYLDKTVWVHPGLSLNFPDGRDPVMKNVLKCSVKTTGRDEENRDTFQPIVKTILNEKVPVTETKKYYFDYDNNEFNIIDTIELLNESTDEESMKIRITQGGNTVLLDYDVDNKEYSLINNNMTLQLKEAIVLTAPENIVMDHTNTYYYDEEDIQQNVKYTIKLPRVCTDADTLAVAITKKGVTTQVNAADITLNEGGETITLANPVIMEAPGEGEIDLGVEVNIQGTFRGIDPGVTVELEYLMEKNKTKQVQSYYFNDEVLESNQVSYIFLKTPCLDINTMAIYYRRNGSPRTKIDIDKYELSDDNITISFAMPIKIERGETEENGGLVIEVEYFETNENIPIYVTEAWEITDPYTNLAFDDSKGRYYDDNGNSYVCCKVLSINSGYIIPKNLRPSETLTITGFAPKTCVILATQDDIANLLTIFNGSSMSMDSMLKSTLEDAVNYTIHILDTETQRTETEKILLEERLEQPPKPYAES